MNKEQMVQRMFSSAAKKYDINNTVLSLGQHRYWKRFTIEQAGVKKGDCVLDVCSGTADMAILLAKKVGLTGSVTAADLNPEMLRIGKRKVQEEGLNGVISCVIGNAEALQFRDDRFDAVTVGFGVRNVTNIGNAFSEMLRVTKPGGRVVCLEFTQPASPFFRYIYDFYSFTLLPAIGTLISKDQTGIYQYLPDSIRKFPPAEDLRRRMLRVGFSEVFYHTLSGGIVAVHVGIK